MDGFVIGVVITFIICLGLIVHAQHNVKEDYEKRCVEVNAGTYEAGQFKYIDDKVKYILTGEK